MSQPYSVKVTITSNAGATVYALQVAQGDDTPGNVAAAYGLADPLSITQKLQVNPKLPLSHPEPEEATVTLIAPDSTTYAALAIGDPVWIQVFPAAAFAGTPVEFFGRIAQPTAEPHPLGVKITLACIDYTADLAELPVGLSAYPVEGALPRLARIAAEIGSPTFPRIPAGWTVSASGPIMSARSAGQTDAYSLIVDTLDAFDSQFRNADETFTAFTPMGAGGHGFYFRPALVPLITGGLLDPVTPWQLRAGVPWTRRVNYAPPARLANLAGVRTITVTAADSSPSTGAPILDAGRVTFAPAFTQTKAGGLFNVTQGVDAQGNRYTWDWRVETGWQTGALTYGPGGWQGQNAAAVRPSGPAIVQEVDSVIDVTDAFTATQSPADIVALYRTPFNPDTRGAWVVGTLEWDAFAEPGAWRRPELTELLTVARTQVGHLPNNREWISGLVAGTTLTIARGRPVFSIDLQPPSYDYELDRWVRGASLGVLSMDSPIIAGVTLSQLSTRDTFADYSLVRGS